MVFLPFWSWLELPVSIMEQSLVSSHRGHPAAPPTACTLPPTPRTLLHFCFVKQQSLLKLTEDIFSSGTTVLCDQAMQVVGTVKDSGKRTISKSITSCNLFHAYIVLLVWFHFCKLAIWKIKCIKQFNLLCWMPQARKDVHQQPPHFKAICTYEQVLHCISP